MKRPKRENYANGIYGYIEYNDRLERYTSYLENRLKEHHQAFRIHDVVGRSEQLLEEQSNWLMANTSLEVEKIVDFKEHFK